MTNAPQLIEAFADRRGLAAEDIHALLRFARRLEIDPLDIDAKKDHVGEYYSKIGPSATVPGRTLTVGYRVDVARRTAEVIAFALE